MFGFISGILSYVDYDIEKTKSKKLQFLFSLFFGVFIFIAICVKDFL